MLRPIQWLVGLAKTKPVLFNIAILLVGCAIFYKAVVYQQRRIENLELINRDLNDKYNRRVDSITLAFQLKAEQASQETKETLKSVIADYQRQLREQQNLNRRVDNTIINNERILKNKKNQLKSLTNDY